MPVVTVRAPLVQLLEGNSEIEIDGTTVEQVLRRLESDYPSITGWVLDESGKLRRHVAVFVNGERAAPQSGVRAADRITILPAISGGARGTELLIGTRKGLVVLRGPGDGRMEIAARKFAGQEVEYALRDARTGTYLAAVTHGQFGPRLYLAEDPAGEWEQARGPAFPEDADAAVERIWKVAAGTEDGVVYAGVAPAALFVSRDSGRTWELNRPLWDEPSRPRWQGGAGGLCLHSICPDPRDPRRLAVAISAAGVWLTDDGGRTWRRGVKGLAARYLPEESPEDPLDLCVHNMHRAPGEPETLYMQFHGGVFRSDDSGETWADVGTDSGLPSDFGFPLVVHPHDPACAYVIPLASDEDRVPAGGRLRVYQTRDRGLSWTPSAEGLPQESYVTVLRQSFAHGRGSPPGLFFGTGGGDVYGSLDEGRTWHVLAEHLPTVLSVRCAS